MSKVSSWFVLGIFFLAVPYDMQELSSSTRDEPGPPAAEVKSLKTLNHQARPQDLKFKAGVELRSSRWAKSTWISPEISQKHEPGAQEISWAWKWDLGAKGLKLRSVRQTHSWLSQPEVELQLRDEGRGSSYHSSQRLTRNTGRTESISIAEDKRTRSSNRGALLSHLPKKGHTAQRLKWCPESGW